MGQDEEVTYTLNCCKAKTKDKHSFSTVEYVL